MADPKELFDRITASLPPEKLAELTAGAKAMADVMPTREEHAKINHSQLYRDALAHFGVTTDELHLEYAKVARLPFLHPEAPPSIHAVASGMDHLIALHAAMKKKYSE